VLDKHAALLVADDVGNIVWRVTASTTTPDSLGRSQQKIKRET